MFIMEDVLVGPNGSSPCWLRA